ncbi:glycosyltransferase [Pseudoalteromonas sp. R3]|uniref:glycosyltransferase n=1 Tax=Pseudoalteromonas sp. R3 TaxID=1709477 RepID=UPI0006B3FDD8|nr:glycosyltransferase [Pseudoalteromonas sp. R3]
MLSVILPAHNEAEALTISLPALVAQLPENAELIVVCDRCSDATAEIARRYTARVFSITAGSAAAARNYGAEQAKGEMFLFLDADTVCSENVPELVGQLALGTGNSVYGTAPLQSDSGHWLGRFIAADINRFNRRHQSMGGNCFVAAGLFRAVDGFNTQLLRGEDTDLGVRCQRQGGRYVWLKGGHFVHNERKFRTHGYVRYYCSLVLGGLLWQLSERLYARSLGGQA